MKSGSCTHIVGAYIVKNPQKIKCLMVMDLSGTSNLIFVFWKPILFVSLVVDSQTKPILTKPNLTKPNLTNPNLTKPN